MNDINVDKKTPANKLPPTIKTPGMSRADKKAMAAAIACVTVFSSASSLILPVLTLNLEMRGESSATIGLLGALLGLAAIVGALAAPALVRRLGATTLLCSCLLIVATANLSYQLFSHSLIAWFIIYGIGSFGVGLIFIISEAIITSLATEKRRAFILGMYTTGFSFGFAIGPIILTFTGIVGWVPFIIASALAATAAGIVVMARVDKSATPAPVKAGFWRLIPESPLPFACAFSLGAAEMSVYDLLPVYAHKIGFSIADAVFLLTVFSVGTMVTQLGAGALGDRFGYRRTLTCAAAAGVLGALAIPFLLMDITAWSENANWIKLILLGLWGGSLMSVYPLGLAEATRTFRPPRLLAANALFGFSYGAGALFGPALTGVAMDITTHGIAPMLALFAALPLIFAFLPRKKRVTP
ncbi:MAG: MFS transporter [Gammaproteobacteria bacterium WSBS_2016_MAG_OTU1]